MGTVLVRPRGGIAALVAVSVLAAGHSAAAGATGLSPREHAVVVDINQKRAEHGRPLLRVDRRLVRAARGHADSIEATGVFEHGAFWQWIERAGITTGRAGETLGWSSPVDGAVARIVTGWMQSPEHRAILLDRSYDDLGVGVRIGPFMGYADAIVVSADFHDR